ncbi:MAG TPA: hypothetical protein VG223_16055 [Solirubrobacteraceae bacterium]|nr:hypothetical protein [Solirubrobacteraceae bacterium]
MILNALQAVQMPLAAFIIIWFAIKQEANLRPSEEGGAAVPPQAGPHPRRPSPRRPRRGPHGDPAPSAPPRVRGAHARGRRTPR